MPSQPLTAARTQDPVWQTICDEARSAAQQEPLLADFLRHAILDQPTLETALAAHLAQALECPGAPAALWTEVFAQALAADAAIGDAIRCDLRATRERDSACSGLSLPFLYFKGFHALQAWRIAHWLWQQGRRALALLLQNRISGAFSVDIHPAARIGTGVMIDHATGVVIGETAVVGNNVSLMQGVTLGGTGKECGDRHPKVGDGVLISAGATVLGNIRIGEGAKIGAGSVVLQEVPPHTTVAGVPAKIVGHPASAQPALEMNHGLSCDMDSCDEENGEQRPA